MSTYYDFDDVWSGEEIKALLQKIEALDVATDEADGLMSSTDKAKLDGIADGAQVNVIEDVVITGADKTTSGKAITYGVDSEPTANSSKLVLSGSIRAFILTQLAYYYLKTETYSKTEVNQLLAGIKQFTYQVADELPTASADTMYIIYLIPSTNPKTRNIKEEYITVRSGEEGSYTYAWELIGSTSIDISGKADKDPDAVEDNIAQFDSNGNPVDSGIAADYINQLGQEVNGVDITSAENTHIPFKIYSGKSYIFTNNSETSVAIYLRITQSSTNQVFVGTITPGASATYTAETDFNYLYFYNTSSANYTVNVQFADSIDEKIKYTVPEGKAFASVNSLALCGVSALPFKGYIGGSLWTDLTNSSHILLICKPGDEITIVGSPNSSFFGFLRDYDFPAANKKVLYCEGTGRTIVAANATATATAPSDVKFLVINKIIQGADYFPTSIKINGVEYPYSKKTVKEYLDELTSALSTVNSRFSDIWNLLITGAEITLAGTSTSNLVLNEPIFLSQDGDEVEIEVSDIGSSDSLAFSNSGVGSNSYYAIQLSKTLIGIRATDGTWLHQSTSIPSASSHKVNISYSGGNILTYVDGTLKNTYTGQKTVRIASFGNGGNGRYGYWGGTIKSIKHNSQEINLYLQQANEATVVPYYRFALAGTTGGYPKGVLKYDASAHKFEFYSRLGDSDKYFMFRVRLHQDDTDIVYLKEWRWSYGTFCQYDNGSFTEIATTAIDAENEMAMYFKDAIDYTGGIHGDERIDVTPSSFVKFFADGRLITDEEMANNFTIECASFAYMQLSSLHETSTVEGEYVAGHPIIAMHYKRNTFENCQSHLENRIIFTTTQYVTQYHAGLMCVGKGTATYALLPNAVSTPELTGTNNTIDADNKKVPRVDMWNPTNGLRCFVEGKMIEGIAESDINVLQVWDRVSDSKYYRRMVVSGSNAKVFQEGDVIINEQDVVYY